MKEYSILRLVSARTRAEVVRDQYPKDRFLAKVTQRIIEDIKAAIMFDELEKDSEVSTAIKGIENKPNLIMPLLIHHELRKK